MNKSLTAALVGCLALVACLGVTVLITTIGCGPDATAVIPNAPVDPDAFGEGPPETNKVVDSGTSWKKFVAEAKQAGRIYLAESKFQESPSAKSVKIIFRKDEMEYVQFGNNPNLKGIDPNKFYEVGVIRVAAKEDWGFDGFQIREYELKFITPKRDGDWKLILGSYQASKSQGKWEVPPTQFYSVEDSWYQKSYLRQLFAQPLTATKPAAAASVNHQGGEQAVETKVNPK